MRITGIITLIMLISSMGLACSACNLGYNTTDIHKWTCLKIIGNWVNSAPKLYLL